MMCARLPFAVHPHMLCGYAHEIAPTAFPEVSAGHSSGPILSVSSSVTGPYHAGHDHNRARSVIPHQGLRDLAVHPVAHFPDCVNLTSLCRLQ